MLPCPRHKGLTAMRTLLTSSTANKEELAMLRVRPEPNWFPTSLLCEALGEPDEVPKNRLPFRVYSSFQKEKRVR